MTPVQENNLQAASSSRTYLEEIAFIKANEKVSGVAATCFQTFVHWFLLTFCCYYSGYGDLYDAEVTRVSRLPPTRIASPPPENQIPAYRSGRASLLESFPSEREEGGLSGNNNEPAVLSPTVEIPPRAIEAPLISPKNATNVATPPSAQSGQIAPAIEPQAVAVAQPPAIDLPNIIKLHPRRGALHDYVGIAGVEKDPTVVDRYENCHYVTLVSPVTGAPIKVLMTGEPGKKENLVGYGFDCHKLCIRKSVPWSSLIQLQHYYEETLFQEWIVDISKLYVIVGTEEKVYIPIEVATYHSDGSFGFSTPRKVSDKLRLCE